MCSVPDEMLGLVVSQCSDTMVLALRGACRTWSILASKDAVWEQRAEAAWQGKHHSALLLPWLTAAMPLWRAYYGSLRDATRQQITFAELAQVEFWCVRFKAAAGQI